MSDSDLETAKAPDSTPVDQGNMHPNNPSTETGDSEKDAVINTTTVQITSLYGTPAQAKSVPQMNRSISNPGVNLMVVNSTNPGAELWLMVAEASQLGSKLFGNYPADQRNLFIFLNATSWTSKFAGLSGNFEAISTEIDMADEALKIGEKSQTDFIQTLVSAHPDKKMFVLDNLIDLMPTWRVTKNRPQLLLADHTALHTACVEQDIVVLAVVDIAEKDNRNLMENYSRIEGTNFSMLHVNGKYRDDGTPEAGLSGNGFDIHLELIDVGDRKKWVEKTPTKKAPRVNTNQGKVRAAIQDIDGEFTDVDVAEKIDDLTLFEIRNALTGLATKGVIHKTRPKHFVKT